MISVSTLNC